MINPGTGIDTTRYLAMTVMMADHMAPGAAREAYRERAIARLVEAVEEDARLRKRCRDTSLEAATRSRGW